MGILNGWKEIADCLNMTSRTAQRWERHGLPVRRVSDSSRSPIIAFSEEIEGWARTRAKGSNRLVSLEAFKATRRETQKLTKELKAVRLEHRRLLNLLHNQIATLRSSSANDPWSFPGTATGSRNGTRFGCESAGPASTLSSGSWDDLGSRGSVEFQGRAQSAARRPRLLYP